MRTASFKALNPQGFHRVVYHEWGDRRNKRVLVCVHGLARNSRDFDALAQTLLRDYRVVCPDIVGRGQSDWLPVGGRYEIPQYVGDMVTLLARLEVDEVDWLGTSMGGIIGMVLASQPNSPIRRLVLNDIGAFVSAQALTRISQYVGQQPRFSSLEAAEQHLRGIYASAFLGLDASQWHHLALHGVRTLDDGQLAWHYDPAIGEQTCEVAGQDIDLWPIWNRVSCPQLLLRGSASDVLDAETAAKMAGSPQVTLKSCPHVGHAPSLMEPEQIRTVVEWLRHA